MNIDELIDIRANARLSKDWLLCDKIRDKLDEHLVFIFDGTEGQEVYYLTEKYFKFKNKFKETNAMSNRKYVEYRIKQDIKHEGIFNGWLHSVNHKKS